MIGAENDTNAKGHEQTETRQPPEYDINSIRPVGEKKKKTNVTATITALGVLTAITVAVTAAVAVYVKVKTSMDSVIILVGDKIKQY